MLTLNAKQPYTECAFAFYEQQFQEIREFFAVYVNRDSYCLIHEKKNQKLLYVNLLTQVQWSEKKTCIISLTRVLPFSLARVTIHSDHSFIPPAMQFGCVNTSLSLGIICKCENQVINSYAIPRFGKLQKMRGCDLRRSNFSTLSNQFNWFAYPLFPVVLPSRLIS